MTKRTKTILWIGTAWGLPLAAAVSVILIANKVGVEEACTVLTPAAVVLAGFSVAAFNLRFRIMDTLHKIELKRSQVDHLATVFAKCRKRIDRCLIYFVLTTLILVSGKFAATSTPWWAAMMFASVGGFFFVFCMIRFWEILGSLRELEDFSISMLKKTAKTL